MTQDTTDLAAQLARVLAPHLPAQHVAPAVQAAVARLGQPHNASLSATSALALAAVAIEAVLPPPYAQALGWLVSLEPVVADWWQSRTVEVQAGTVTITDHR